MILAAAIVKQMNANAEVQAGGSPCWCHWQQRPLCLRRLRDDAWVRVGSEYLANSMDAVKGNFEFFGFLDPNVHFVKGLVKDSLFSLSKSHEGPIAVLRVDGNFYDSFQDAMYYLYPKVPVGGIVIFDDVMFHPSVMAFWKNFKQDYRMPEELNRIDHHSAWFWKETLTLHE